MRARDVMTRPVATVRPDDSLAHAAVLMRDHDCGSVVVTRRDRTAVAVLTDRDICLAALRAGKPLKDLRVDHAMSRRLHACMPDDEVRVVERLMSVHRVRRVPVLDELRRVVGIVSLDHLARIATRERQLDYIAPHVAAADVGDVLGDVCRPRLAGCGDDESQETEADR